MNVSDTRLSGDDDELYWCENAMLVGKGVQAVPLYNGAVTRPYNGSVRASFGCQLLYGAFTVPHAVIIIVYADGAAWMRDLDAVTDTEIGPATTFNGGAGTVDITIWRAGPVLFIDSTKGYIKWDGATRTTIDATKTGTAIGVFESHAWLLTATRTVTYTAPNTYDDFTAGNGAGSFALTDEAFAGGIQHLFSTVEQLWIMGKSAIDALGNVASTGVAPSVVTTFSVTNAVNTIGTNYGYSMESYFRAIVFATSWSIYSLLGVTPQKLSGKLDRLFSALDVATGFTAAPRLAVTTLYGRLVLCAFWDRFTDPVSGVVSSKMVCFDEGRGFLVAPGTIGNNRVRDIVSVVSDLNILEVHAIDEGGYIYRLFARTADAKRGTFTISSKLHDLGAPVEGHQALRLGFDLSGPVGTATTDLTVTLTNEQTTTALAAVTVTMLPTADAPLGFRYAFHRVDAPIVGQRLGWTLTGNCADLVCLEAAHLQYDLIGEWDTVA